MNILVARETLLEGGLVRQVGENPQLDLRIIRCQQDVALGGNERLAKAPAFLGAYRNVLQIGLARGESAGSGHRLVEGGVNPAGAGVDQLRQRIGVGTLEL